METRRAAVRDALAGPDTVVSFLVLTFVAFTTYLTPFPPVQATGYILIIAFGSGAVAVVAWITLAVVAGTSSRYIRTKFGNAEWNRLSDGLYPLATSLAAIGLVVMGWGLRPAVLPIETSVTTCTPSGCETAVELINTPNLFAVTIGLVLLVLGGALIVAPSPLVTPGRSEDPT